MFLSVAAFVVFCIILIGAACDQMQKHFGIPHLISNLTAGVLLGLWAEANGYFEYSMDDLDKLFGTYSDYYFFFFVPTSTFMNGYLADFHMFRREFYNVWILSSINYWITLFLVK
jgi:NhaP-type Na+/H+ or K+/H+ antiporter